MSMAREFLKSIREGFIAEVQVSGEEGWTRNALVFATQEEAQDYVDDLGSRWTAVTNTRVTPVDEEPNYTFIDWELQKIGG